MHANHIHLHEGKPKQRQKQTTNLLLIVDILHSSVMLHWVWDHIGFKNIGESESIVEYVWSQI